MSVSSGQGVYGGWAPVDAITPGVRDRAEAEVAETLEEWRRSSEQVDPFDAEVEEAAPSLPPARPGWQREAACRGLLGSPEWEQAFFPSDAGADNHGARAKQVCASCPVWTDCLTEAVDRHELVGIWGGAGGGQLRMLGRARRKGGVAWEAALADHRRDLDAVAAGRRPAGATDANGAGATCGVATTYARGCRCTACEWGMRFARNRPPSPDPYGTSVAQLAVAPGTPLPLVDAVPGPGRGSPPSPARTAHLSTPPTKGTTRVDERAVEEDRDRRPTYPTGPGDARRVA